MSNGGIPVKVILKGDTGKEVAQTTIDAPSDYEFPDQSPGKYTVAFVPPPGFEVKPPNPRHITLEGERTSIKGNLEKEVVTAIPGKSSSSPEESSSNPPFGLIVLAALSMTLLGRLSLVEDFSSLVSPTKTAQPERVQSSSEPRSKTTNNDYVNELSPEVDARLRKCLKENSKRLLGIPSLTELVESLDSDKENSKTEFQKQIISLYEPVQRLRKTIEDCDPILVQEIIAAENRRIDQGRSQNTVMIVGDLVNVRAGSSLGSKEIGQVSYGTILQVDTKIFTYLSEEQRLAITTGEGWYPIILSDGRRGYVYSGYVEEREKL